MGKGHFRLELPITQSLFDVVLSNKSSLVTHKDDLLISKKTETKKNGLKPLTGRGLQSYFLVSKRKGRVGELLKIK